MKKKIFINLVIGSCVISSLNTPALAGSELSKQAASRASMISSAAAAAAGGDPSGASSSSSSSAPQLPDDWFSFSVADVNGIIAGMVTNGQVCNVGYVRHATQLLNLTLGHLEEAESVIQIRSDSPSQKVKDLYQKLQTEASQLAGMGPMYLIRDPETDPTKKVAPFVLSGAAPRTMNHYKAEGGIDPLTTVEHKGYCKGIGERQANNAELLALRRATSRNGHYDPDSIPGLFDSYVWSSSVHPDHADRAFFFNGNYGCGNLIATNRTFADGSVRCVRPVAAW